VSYFSTVISELRNCSRSMAVIRGNILHELKLQHTILALSHLVSKGQTSTTCFLRQTYYCEQNRSVANVQNDDLWPSCMHAATHILQEKTHACGVLKRHYFWVHVSRGSAETLVRRGGIINHHSIAYSLSNISAKNYRNRLMWVESIVCNISVVFLGHSVKEIIICDLIFQIHMYTQ